MHLPSKVEIALRAYTLPVNRSSKGRKVGKARGSKTASRTASPNPSQPWMDQWSELALVIACETTPDEIQSLDFGMFQFYRGAFLVEEGLFYPDDTPEEKIEELKRSIEMADPGDLSTPPITRIPVRSKIAWMTQSEFIQRILFKVCYKAGGVLTGWDLSHTLAVMARGYNPIDKGFYQDGFIFHFKEYIDSLTGKSRMDIWKPRMVIKSIGQSRASIQWIRPINYNPKRDKSQAGTRPGAILDLYTLSKVFLESVSHSINSAFELFGIDHPEPGDPVQACRMRLQATWKLYQAERAEAACHAVSVPPNQWYSAASLGKAYLSQMGIVPPALQVDPGLSLTPEDVMGIAMTTYHGGRAETRLVKATVPVVYLDFVSMYPSVYTLMELWAMATAENVRVYDDTKSTLQWLETLTPEDGLRQDTWKRLNALVQIEPDGDFLPVRRMKPNHETATSWGLLSVDPEVTDKKRWFALADVLTSWLIMGKLPNIYRVLRFTPSGRQENLRTVSLRGTIEVNPYENNLYKTLVEERKKDRPELSRAEGRMLGYFLKQIANGSSYGVPIELNPVDLSGKIEGVRVYTGQRPYQSVMTYYEKPGRFFFPPLATLITAGAHFMLALLQNAVEAQGGTYAFMNTDSMAVVASAYPETCSILDFGGIRVPVLPREEIDRIVERFDSLNPYDARIIPHLIKMEPENYPPKKEESFLCYNRKTKVFAIKTGEDEEVSRQDDLWIYTATYQSHCLYNQYADWLILRKSSYLVLGTYLSPDKGDPDDRQWIDRAWLLAIAGDYRGMDSGWASQPALYPIKLNHPLQMTTAHLDYNRHFARGSYSKGIKPFNTVVRAAKSSFHICNDEQGELVFRQTGKEQWIAWDARRFSEKSIVVDRSILSPGHPIDLDREVYASSYRDVIEKTIPENGSGASSWMKQRAPVREWIQRGIRYIGKEGTGFNFDEAVLTNDRLQIIQVYTPDLWEALREELFTLPIHLVAELGKMTENKVTAILRGDERPAPETLNRLQRALPAIREWDCWMREKWPGIQKMMREASINDMTRLTGIGRSEVFYLKNGEKRPGIQTALSLEAWSKARPPPVKEEGQPEGREPVNAKSESVHPGNEALENTPSKNVHPAHPGPQSESAPPFCDPGGKAKPPVRKGKRPGQGKGKGPVLESDVFHKVPPAPNL